MTKKDYKAFADAILHTRDENSKLAIAEAVCEVAGKLGYRFDPIKFAEAAGITFDEGIFYID
jgi:hypothetical protein